jgi:2-polyprenyl-3-methyl-5-hydroxy-6-metoxy-1,4-benzoquinol methylase
MAANMTWLKQARQRLGRWIGGEPPPQTSAQTEQEKLRQVLALLNDKSQPNLNALTEVTRNLDALALNVKTLGYHLAQDLAAALPLRENTRPRRAPLGSKPSTQHDMESEWVAHWCSQLKVPVMYHRKLWELAYILQVAHNAGHLREGARGLGFGCGTEPLASYFAGQGARVTITDLAPDDARSQDWSGTNQHASSLDDAFHPRLVSRDAFDALVDFRAVDMNAIPDDLTGYDFCWSTCALEHLGSIAHGLAFIENSVKTLRPGGTAIHTTEFNINPVGPTIDNWPTVLFQRQHFEQLAERLEAAGHRVAPLDFDPGSKPLDKFIDIPPWNDGTMAALSARLGQAGHLKVAIDGFVTTCFGITVTRAG